MRHILGACPSALHQGRFTWRHDNVLNILVSAIHDFLRQCRTTPSENGTLISFVPAGDSHKSKVAPRQRLTSQNILAVTSDWVLLHDSASTPLFFPSAILVTTLRPDIVLYSTSRKKVIWVELTVCLEDRFSASNVKKERRYAGLAQRCEAAGWEVHPYSIEMGVRGFVPRSLRICLRELGFAHSSVQKICRTCSRVAVRSSYILWVKRGCVTFAEEPFR